MYLYVKFIKGTSVILFKLWPLILLDCTKFIASNLLWLLTVFEKFFDMCEYLSEIQCVCVCVCVWICCGLTTFPTMTLYLE